MAGGGGGGVPSSFLMLSPNLLKSQIPYKVVGEGTFQHLMLSPNLPKYQIPYMVGGGGGGGLEVPSNF